MLTISCSRSRPRADMAKARRARHQELRRHTRRHHTMDTQKDQDQLEVAKLNGHFRSLLVRPELLTAPGRRYGPQRRLRLPNRRHRSRDQLQTGGMTGDGVVGIKGISGDEDPQTRHPHGPAAAAPVQEEERLCGLRAGSRGGGDRRVPSVYRPILAQECFALLLVYICTERCGCGLDWVLRAPPRGE